MTDLADEDGEDVHLD
jgi:hypothetical protein